MERKEQTHPREEERTIEQEEIFAANSVERNGASSSPASDAPLDKAAYERNLSRYEVTFSRALEKTYPEIDRTVREQLQQRSQDLKLTSEDVRKIEDLVTAKAIAHRTNLQQYRQAFREIIRSGQLTDRKRYELKQRQRILGLSDVDVSAIENEIANEKIETKIEPRRRHPRPIPKTVTADKHEPEKKKFEFEKSTDASVARITPITTPPIDLKPFPIKAAIGIITLLLLVGAGAYVYPLLQKEWDHFPWPTLSREEKPPHAEQSESPPQATGQVIIRSNVPQDRVYIDDQWVGHTGPDPHLLAIGKHIIRVEKPGFEPFETRIELTPNREEIIYVQLIPKAPPPGKTFQDKLKDGSLGPKMIVLPAGEFLMGSSDQESMRYDGEGPQHLVRIAHPFAIGVTAITFNDYDRFARATKRKLPKDGGWGRGKRPVININWYDAKAYAKWLGNQTGGKKYRLPSEAEWEYAARAGTTTPFSTGKCIHTKQANYKGDYDYADCGAKTGISRGKTVPVGSLPTNPWGLREMHGNVWEWTTDCWHYDYEDAPTDGSAWGKENKGYCSERVVRGGGWGSGPRSVRSAVRSWDWANVATADLGFRLVKVIQP
uniref:Formylglycine-generating enzyme, required for sulfatase activity, contains SUMF1/FGE domain n=1 Tax=Candidatus Kentrum sp. TC TaxID=2126339 RepID=A0A450Z474_9GAMM|nr:MAG: Formylglycine-generating enzyme, required for sulfatase activity, contains SUMF1/FGE domain [Candidatus Kentron sp. TC]